MHYRPKTHCIWCPSSDLLKFSLWLTTWSIFLNFCICLIKVYSLAIGHKVYIFRLKLFIILFNLRISQFLRGAVYLFLPVILLIFLIYFEAVLLSKYLYMIVVCSCYFFTTINDHLYFLWYFFILTIFWYRKELFWLAFVYTNCLVYILSLYFQLSLSYMFQNSSYKQYIFLKCWLWWLSHFHV